MKFFQTNCRELISEVFHTDGLVANFSPKKQCVDVDASMNDEGKLKFGVPLESVLGLILFYVYIIK